MKLTKLFVSVILCLMFVAPSFANDSVRFHPCSPRYPDLCATNTSDKAYHLFITMEYIGCNGAKTPVPTAQYKLIPGQDFNEETKEIYPSYYWKISHYDHHFMMSGDRVNIQNAPCYEGTINYGKLGRIFVWNTEQWENFKTKVREQNPNCPWAK